MSVKSFLRRLFGTGDAKVKAAQRTHTVQVGDTLSAISLRYYGTASQYMRIYDANRGQIKDPDLIYPGQVLKIPD